MLEKLKYLSTLYNSGKFLELQAILQSFKEEEIEQNKNLLKLCLLNINQLGNSSRCVHLSKIYLTKYNLDYEIVLIFYINAEKSKSLNIFNENYLELLNNTNFKNINKVNKIENLINFLLSKNEGELALLTVKQLLKKKEGDIKLTYFLTAQILYRLRKYRASLFWFLKLFCIDETNLRMSIEIGNIYNLLRDKKNAIEYLHRASKIDSLKPRAYKILSTIYNYKKEINHFNEMIKFAMKNNEKEEDSYLLNFAISKAYEDKHDYKSAHYFFTKANLQKNMQLPEGINIFKNEIEFFCNLYKNKKLFLFKKTIADFRPIFVVGLPRSGTTLIDRILSSCTNAISYGESPQFANQFKYYFNSYSENEAIQDFQNFDEKQILSFRENYLNKILKSKKNKIFIDKMPFNYLYIPLIKKIFPNSIIILTKRDLRDVGLSLLKNYFADSRLNFVYSEKHILDYFKLYQKVIALFKKEYNEYFYEINYSELVLNPKKQIKALSQACDFEITADDDLLNNVSNNFIADTVSINQADRKIYTSSNLIYKNYEPLLGNFFSKIQNIYDE